MNIPNKDKKKLWGKNMICLNEMIVDDCVNPTTKHRYFDFWVAVNKYRPQFGFQVGPTYITYS